MRPPARLPAVTLLLYIVFTLSGAAGLIYESIWSRYLGLFVGHSAYAQIIVLVIFLGGMSLGAMFVGRRSERLASPLLWYAGVELAVGLIGLVFHDAFVVVTRIAYDSIFPAMAAGPAITIAKWTIASLLILPQSVLLGATFPLMSAGVLRRGGGAGRVLSLLYFTNSLGAAAGVLAAGFWLIRISGLPGTLVAAAMVNIVVALAVFLAVRSGHAVETPAPDVAATTPGVSPATGEPAAHGALPDESARLRPLWRLMLLVSFGTAAASFIYEIAWIRMLSLVLGSATHSFELMLSAFILGLALGALWAHRHADRFTHPLLTLGIVQCAMGALALATLPLYLGAFQWTADLLGVLGRTPASYTWFTIARYGLSLLVMLPATFCAGITLPLITRTLLARGSGERAVGAVYGVNTLGSIVGAAVGGLVLLPALGLKGLLLTGAFVDVALGVWLVSRNAGTGRRARARSLAVATAALLLLAGTAWTARLDPLVLTSGVYRYGRVTGPESERIVFYEDGRTSTVSVRQERSSGMLVLATNGKPDASLAYEWLKPKADSAGRHAIGGDQNAQMLLPLVTLAHAPRAREGAVIGQGSGMSSHLLLGSPVLAHLVTIDIEPQMIRGSHLFHPANRRVFDDPRSEFAIDDAKSYFAAGRRRYDLILSEPSNPWVSGVSGLFTTEFYHRVRTYLNPGGVFGQWLHLYEIDDGLVLSVIRAVHENFPSYEIFLVGNYDMLIVASNERVLPRPDWGVLQYPDIAKDLRHVLPMTGEHLEAARVIGRDVLAPMLDVRARTDAGANSDFYPTLDQGAELTRFMNTNADGFATLSSARFDLVAAIAGRRRDFGVSTLAPIPEIVRMRALAVGARLRAAAAGTPDTLTTDADATGPAFLRQTFERSMAAGVAPSDWRLWTRSMLEVEQDVHGGTAGVADERFYSTLDRFLAVTNAPPFPRSIVRFTHGMAAWDWPAVLREAPTLAVVERSGERWIPPLLVRDAVVIAHLRTGDQAGARAAFNSLSRRIPRGTTDLRSRILQAHLGR